MPRAKIEKLTPEQEALIPVYREKWKAIALTTEPVDRDRAAEAVKFAYPVIYYQEPEIIFCPSPLAGIGQLIQILNSSKTLGAKIYSKFDKRLFSHIVRGIQDQLNPIFWYFLVNQSIFLTWDAKNALERQLEEPLNEELYSQLHSHIHNLAIPMLWVIYGFIADFCISVLKCHHDAKKWKALQLLINDCGPIFPYENLCIICDRPRILSFDNEKLLHAEGTPAIQFADGFSVYAHHGLRLPEKYGKIHPKDWSAEWLLSEDNAELRRMLIQEIGYERICQELQTVTLDYWREYELLTIETDIDDESINLLKMTCPSTGKIHVLRVPPNIESAREAIRWVNWGIDPEEFSVQT